jgi:hypothetical protein
LNTIYSLRNIFGIVVDKVPHFNDKTYSCTGGETSYDAISYGLSIIDKNKQIDKKVHFCVIANTSKRTNKSEVKEMFKKYKAKV